MKVLLTGGFGYLGSVVTEHLLSDGHSVRLLDAGLYSKSTDFPLCEIVHADIRDADTLDTALDAVDAVIHLAAIVGDRACDVDGELAIETNYLAARLLAQKCQRRHLRLLFASTCSVYGAQPDPSPLTEESNLLPASLYAITKLAAEETIGRCARDSLVLRLGTLFGYSPRMRFDLVVNRFVGQALEDGAITVLGGDQYRPFLSVGDAAKMFVRALGLQNTGVYNFGGHNFKIKEIADIVRRRIGCRVEFLELQDPRNYVVDSGRAVTDFGVKFSDDIERCLDQLHEAYRSSEFVGYRDAIYSNEATLKTLGKLPKKWLGQPSVNGGRSRP